MRTVADSRKILITMLALSAILILVILMPFGSALFMAAVLVSTFHPWMVRLTARLNGRRKIAAFLLTFGLVIALVVPIVSFGIVLLREARETFVHLQGALEQGGVEGLIAKMPPPLASAADFVWRQFPDREEGAQIVFEAEKRIAGTLPRFVALTGGVIGQIALMVVALYFLLLDGDQFLNWVDAITPLRRKQLLELLIEFRRVSVAVLLGSFVTAAAQTVVALAGYAIAGVPSLLFCTVLTFLIGLVPLLGAGVISFVIALYMLMTGHTGAAIFLMIWSVGVVGLIDNIVRPWLLKDGIALHGAVVFFSLLGGVTMFGPVGLIIGPLSFSFFLALLRMVRREERVLEKAEPDVEAAAL